MNWVLGDQQVELTDGTKGICISTYALLLWSACWVASFGAYTKLLHVMPS